VGEGIVMAAGRPMSPAGQVRQRGERLAIALSGKAIDEGTEGSQRTLEDLELKSL